MALSWVCFTPHPPIIVPEVGRGHEQEAQETVIAMQNLSEALYKKQPVDTLIIITPHNIMLENQVLLIGADEFYGDLSQFGAAEVNIVLKGDLTLYKMFEKEVNLPYVRFLSKKEHLLDHAAIVPLYYILKPYSPTNYPKLVLITPGFIENPKLISFGKYIRKIIETADYNIGVIVSGDLSHRLKWGAPAGYSPKGKIFDEIFVEAVKANDPQPLLRLDETFIAEAGECGLKPAMIMFGITENMQPHFLSYEGPFGVGYCVCYYLS